MDPLPSRIQGPAVRALCLAALAAIAGATLSSQTSTTPPLDPARAGLVSAQRDAVALVTRAARPDTAPDARRQALRGAAERLRTLGADPPAQGPTPESSPTSTPG